MAKTTQASTFTEGKIFSPLIRFALPVLIALFFQAMYGAADMMIVGQFGTAADVSAVSTGSQIMQTITSIIIGLSIGTTVLLGQRIGEGNSKEAGNTIGGSIALFTVIAIALTILMEVFSSQIAVIMQTPKEAFEGTLTYIRICSAGLLFIVAYNLLGSIFRGMGNSKIPLLCVAIACAINIGGDLLL